MTFLYSLCNLNQKEFHSEVSPRPVKASVHFSRHLGDLHCAQRHGGEGHTSSEIGAPLSKGLKAWNSLEPGANMGFFCLLESNPLPFPEELPLHPCVRSWGDRQSIPNLPLPEDSARDSSWTVARSLSQDK